MENLEANLPTDSLSLIGKKYEEMLKIILGQLGSDEDKIVLTEVLLALKLEGLIGKELTAKDAELVNIITKSIAHSPETRENALLVAKRLDKDFNHE